MSESYPLLLSPLAVGRHRLRNRVMMGAMHTRIEQLGDPLGRTVAFYRARARGGVGLIVTGGFAPNPAGRLEPDGPVLTEAGQVAGHRTVTDAVHAEGALMLLQILHAGRYARHDELVGVSARRAPINPLSPRVLDDAEIEATIEDYCRCAELARLGGYDGIEVMGSEGYLISQFTAPRTNDRTDRWGGSLENRCRFPIELVARLRRRLGPDFLIMFRISALDLVEDGLTPDQTIWLARAIEAAGADILNTGYGWHEATIPTIAAAVPRGAWAFAAARLKQAVRLPVVACNRIATPELAEEILAGDGADLVSLARPLLADPAFVAKAAAGRPDRIAPCVACNQGCLDRIFSERTATCLVNPLACRETEFDLPPITRRLRLAVVGGGPAGVACAATAAARGHRVTLFERAPELGGQLTLGCRIPGKTEFAALLRHFRQRIAEEGVELRIGIAAGAAELDAAGFDRVVVATGVRPRLPVLEGIDHPKVVGYAEAIRAPGRIGRRVAIIGSGGIGHDLAMLLTAGEDEDFYAAWGVDRAGCGLCPPRRPVPPRSVTLLQRSPKAAPRLGKTTGWIVRSRLRAQGVRWITGAAYRRIDDAGLHITVNGEDRLIEADTVVLCAGQEPCNELAAQLRTPHDLIGGARLAAELDALRAIAEGTRLGYELA